MVGAPIRVDGLVISDDEIAPTVLNPLDGRVLVTNKVGQRIIELCDGHTAVDSIAEQIAREFAGAAPEAIRADVDAFLGLARESGVVR